MVLKPGSAYLPSDSHCLDGFPNNDFEVPDPEKEDSFMPKDVWR